MKTALIIIAIILLQITAFSQRSIDRKQPEREGMRTEGMKAEEYWEQLEKSIDHSNKFPVRNKNYFVYKQWKQETLKRQQQRGINSVSPTLNGDWQQLYQVQSDVGMGRIESVAFDPGNSNIFYVATSGGGLWKTTNFGSSYFPLTDGIPTGGVQEVVVDQFNSSIIYIACGGGNGANGPSIGILKSYDGGFNWIETGLMQNLFANDLNITDMVQQPGVGNSATLFLSTSNNGVYKTTNGGDTWENVYPNVPVFDLEFKPGNNAVIYASHYNNISVSNLSGNTGTWNLSGIYPAFPFRGCCSFSSTRMAVTGAAPDSIYLAVTVGEKYEYNGDVFLLKGKINVTNNDISYSASTVRKIKVDSTSMVQSGGGRGYAEIFVSPGDNKNILVGGLETLASSDYGNTWRRKSFSALNSDVRYMHVDVATIAIYNGYVYCTNDGGIYRQPENYSSSNAWTDISASIEITQSYNIAGTPQDPAFYIYANQDNGTQVRTATQYYNFVGGDGTNGAIDYTDPQIYYGTIQAGEFLTRYDHGTYKDITAGRDCNCPDSVPYSGNFVFPFQMDENVPTTLYAAKTRFYKSTNKGSSWINYVIPTVTKPLRCIAVPKTNSSFFYGLEDKPNAPLIRCENISTGIFAFIVLPPNLNVSSITISPNDQDHLFITSNGFNDNVKVFESFDGGNSWNNISADLPNVNVRCLAYASAAVNGIYVGTDLGVYYRDDNLGHWIPYNNDLPVTYVMDLYINTTNKTISAGTYGRGIWVSGLYAATECPGNLGVNVATLSGRQTYSAGFVLTSTTTLTGGANTKIQFTSGQDIKLLPGFFVPAQNSFVAEIAPCGGVIDGYKTVPPKVKKVLPLPVKKIKQKPTIPAIKKQQEK